MITFNRIKGKKYIGKILKILPNSLVIPILQGFNKRFRWYVGHGNAEYWLGTYEHKKQLAIIKFTKKNMVCYDIGAFGGFYSLMFSRLTGEKGKVYSFEPNPHNLSWLLKNIKINNIKNIEVYPVALCDKKDFIPLHLNDSMTKLDEKDKNTKLISPTYNIDGLVLKKYLKPPKIIKIDVEGAELEVLKGGIITIKNNSPLIFVALDSKAKAGKVYSLLRKLNYKILDLDKKEVTTKNLKNTREIMALPLNNI